MRQAGDNKARLRRGAEQALLHDRTGEDLLAACRKISLSFCNVELGWAMISVTLSRPSSSPRVASSRTEFKFP